MVALCGLLCLQWAFVAPKAKVSPEAAAAVGAVLATPEVAHARLPEEFVIFAPIVDVLPVPWR